MAGHLGRKKTTSRILSKFFWLTLFKDVSHFCRCCESCQKYSHRKGVKAPMISLPVIAEPFEQRAGMDNVGHYQDAGQDLGMYWCCVTM